MMTKSRIAENREPFTEQKKRKNEINGNVITIFGQEQPYEQEADENKTSSIQEKFITISIHQQNVGLS